MKFSKVFLTSGCGVCKIKDRGESAKLMSFEKALRSASIAPFNWVEVNSIFPPKAELITLNEGLELLKGREGEQLFYVCAKQSSIKDGEQLAAAVGVAMPTDNNQYGYLSELHTPKTGETKTEIKDRAEDLAAEMLSYVMGVSFDLDKAWDEVKEQFLVGNKIINTKSACSMAIGKKDHWTTVISAAVLI